jgi:hypothetical protein
MILYGGFYANLPGSQTASICRYLISDSLKVLPSGGVYPQYMSVI